MSKQLGKAFVVERLVEGGRWIFYGHCVGSLATVLNHFQKRFPAEALESLRIRRA